MEFADAACIAWRWNTEECVTTRSKPVIKTWTEFCEWPHRHNRCEPTPTRQHANHFNPSEVTFAPASVDKSNMHLFRHLFACVRLSTLENFRIVVVEPFEPPISVERLNMFVHPAAKVALTVGEYFNLTRSIQRHRSAGTIQYRSPPPQEPRQNNMGTKTSVYVSNLSLDTLGNELYFLRAGQQRRNCKTKWQRYAPT